MISVALKKIQFRRNAYLSILLVVVFYGMSVSLASAEKMRVVVSSFPLYDFAKKVGGDLVDVKLLLPPGVEAHGFSPTPHDMIAMQRADLFLYTSKNLESWAEAFVEASLCRNFRRLRNRRSQWGRRWRLQLRECLHLSILCAFSEGTACL